MLRNTDGFALIYLLVTIAVLMATATVIMATDVEVRGRVRVNTAHSTLLRLDSAMANFQGPMTVDGVPVTQVGMLPGQLTHLANPISQQEENTCGQRYLDAATNWQGPYFDQVVTELGIRIGVGTAQNLLVRSASGGQPCPGKGNQRPTRADVFVRITNVRDDHADRLDQLFDDGDGRNAGRVRWDQPQDGFTTVRYYTHFATCDC